MENTTNSIEFTRRYFLREKASESHAVNGMTTISATRYDVGTQEISSELAPSVPAMSRSEELVTMILRTAIKHPRSTPVTQIQVFSVTRSEIEGEWLSASIAGFIVLIATGVLLY